MSANDSTHDDIMIHDSSGKGQSINGVYFQPAMSEPGVGTPRAILKLTAGGVARTMRL